MVDTAGTIFLWSLPLIAAVLILVEDKRIMRDRKEAAKKA